MNKSPRVSVCIHTYNRPHLLKEALDSIFNQTFQDFEVVITDNSKDFESKALVESYRDTRIRYFHNGSNIGPFLNVEKCTLLAETDLIKYLMDDDRLMPTCLERMVEVMDQHPDVALVTSPLRIINESGQPAAKTFYGFKRREFLYVYRQADEKVPSRDLLVDILTSRYPCCVPSGILFRRSVLERRPFWDPNSNFTGDVEFVSQLCLRAPMYFIRDPLAEWRFSETSATVAFYKDGFKIEIFYYLTRTLLNAPLLRKLFTDAEIKKLERDAYLFADFRSLMNLISFARTLNFKILLKTFWIIFKLDPFKINLLRLPHYSVKQILGILNEKA
jgi:glycosyltransferase involved in cell wall biosynthesis